MTRCRSDRPVPALRVGVFGLLGLGNLGNDGSMEAVLNFLRAGYPEAVVDAMCAGPDALTARYGIDAVRLHWHTAEYRTAAGLRGLGSKAVGKLVDAFRIASWVRRHDVVIVPGMGVLEATLPLRPWGFPYSLLCLTAGGRLVGTTVALVGVGADRVTHRATRWMITNAARLAHYRSYRDELSRAAMAAMGVDVTDDKVYPDLAFALPRPEVTASPGLVGVGVMSYHGGNDDRARADEIYRGYRDALHALLCHLVDHGRRVRLFIGDRMDLETIEELLAQLRASRPDLDPSRLDIEPAQTLHDLMRQMAEVETVVATRFHNVLSALKLSKPTISLSYAAKNDVLMSSMGLGEFCQSARAIDGDRLIAQFDELEARRGELTELMNEGNRAIGHAIAGQFIALSAVLARFSGGTGSVVLGSEGAATQRISRIA